MLGLDIAYWCTKFESLPAKNFERQLMFDRVTASVVSSLFWDRVIFKQAKKSLKLFLHDNLTGSTYPSTWTESSVVNASLSIVTL